MGEQLDLWLRTDPGDLDKHWSFVCGLGLLSQAPHREASAVCSGSVRISEAEQAGKVETGDDLK